MILTNGIYYFCLLLIFSTKNIWTYECLKCATEIFNHVITPDNISFPTEDDCNIVTAVHGCYVHIDWLADGTTQVYYEINPTLPYDSILIMVERQVILDTGVYSTRKSIGYSCRSNRTACNTIDNIKRIVNSLTFPTDEQKAQLDRLIAPTKNFNTTSCIQRSNMKNCPKMNLINCQQCMSIVQYTQPRNICSTCSTGKITRNFFIYHSIIFLNMISRSERVVIGCQKGNACNSMKNIEKIKQILTIELDLKKFYRSTTSTTKTTAILLFMVVFIELFRLIDQQYSSSIDVFSNA
jgi:hypothetical protein